MPQDDVSGAAPESPESEETPESAEGAGGAESPETPAEAEETAVAAPPASAERMQRRRGCGLVAWVVVLAAVLAVAAFLVHKAQVEELRRQQEEQLERRAVRATQMDQIGTNLVKALKAAEEGDISSALLILESQGEILAAVAKEAAASHDAEDATGAADKKSALAQAASGIRQKQEETRAFAVRQISGLAVQFPQVREASTKAAAEGTEAGATPQPETPAGGEGAEATPAPEAPAPTGEGQAAPAPAPGAGP